MRDSIVSNMYAIAWAGMLLGVVSGAVVGLFFHREDWMGGYNSFRRRLTRLGHISFFGLAFVNIAFATSHHIAGIGESFAFPAAIAFTIGAATMPTCCFLSAWRKPFRHLFFIPVGSVLTGIILTLAGWPWGNAQNGGRVCNPPLEDGIVLSDHHAFPTHAPSSNQLITP